MVKYMNPFQRIGAFATIRWTSSWHDLHSSYKNRSKNPQSYAKLKSNDLILEGIWRRRDRCLFWFLVASSHPVFRWVWYGSKYYRTWSIDPDENLAFFPKTTQFGKSVLCWGLFHETAEFKFQFVHESQSELPLPVERWKQIERQRNK